MANRDYCVWCGHYEDDHYGAINSCSKIDSISGEPCTCVRFESIQLLFGVKTGATMDPVVLAKLKAEENWLCTCNHERKFHRKITAEGIDCCHICSRCKGYKPEPAVSHADYDTLFEERH